MPLISNDTHNLYNYLDVHLIYDKEILKSMHFKVGEKKFKVVNFFYENE